MNAFAKVYCEDAGNVFGVKLYDYLWLPDFKKDGHILRYTIEKVLLRGITQCVQSRILLRLSEFRKGSYETLCICNKGVFGKIPMRILKE